MFATRNNAHQCEADIKNFGYVRVLDTEGTHAANQKNVVVSKLCLEGWRTETTEALSVPRILSECAPFKVSDNIVGFDRVNMVNDGMVVGVRNECERDQSVDTECRLFPILSEDQSGISTISVCGFVNLRSYNLASSALDMTVTVEDFAPNAPDATQVTDFVAPFVSNDRSPFFNESDIHVTGCLSGSDGLMIKDPSHAATFGGSAIMAASSDTYNRRLRFR